MKYYIGIDPGFSGAISIINNEKEIEALWDMPVIMVGKKRELDGRQVREIFRNYETISHIFIEKSQTMPGQGISSSGRYMESYGRIRGICEGMIIPYTLIHPKTWKKKMMNDMGKEKGASIVRAKQLYPNINLPLVKDHGRADAVLITLYGIGTL